jgi:hypothetical protein
MYHHRYCITQLAKAMQKKLIMLWVLLIAAAPGLKAQQTTSSSGASYTSPSGNMSIVIGQFNYETKGTKSTITGGVLQVYHQREPVAPSLLSLVTYWPNPTTDKLFIKITGNTETDITCQIFDLFGKKLAEQKLDPVDMSIEFKKYKPGLYVILMLLPNQLPVQFKVIKI